MELKFGLNLKDLCVIAVADSLWNKEDIILKTKTYFCSPTIYKKLDMWDIITEEVINQLEPQSLPEILYTEVVHVTDCLGKKIRDWFRYCRMRSIFRVIPKEQLYEKYFKKVFWTSYGTVNEEKIVKSWFHDSNCDLWKVYIMACCFCSEEVIKEIWDEVHKKYKPADFEYLYNSYGSHLAAYWNRRFTNTLDNFIADIKLKFWSPGAYNEAKSVEENMFRLAITKGYKQAAKIFWLELSEQNRAEIFVDCFVAVAHYNDEGEKFIAKDYRTEQFTEIMLFLLNQINDKQMQLINMKGEVFRTISENMSSWPWIKLLVPYVNRTKDFLDEYEYETLFIEIGSCSSKKYYPNRDNILQRIFYQLWRMVPINIKKDISKDVIDRLFYSWDIVNLKKILNDENLSKKRRKLITRGYRKFETFVQENHQQLIDEFINLLIPLKWEKEIQTNMEIIYHHVMKGKFILADELLSTFCRSEEEVFGFKSTVDHNIICIYFIKKNQLELADEFLHWKSNSVESVNNFKRSVYLKRFAVGHILSFWDTRKENAEEAKLQSNKFLNWFLHSEGLIEDFITKCFKDFKFVPFFSKTDNFEIIEDFMSWCLISDVQKNCIMRECLSDVNLTWKMEGYMLKNKRDEAERLLNFAFETENKKMEFMENFFKSYEAIRACKLFIAEVGGSTMFEPKQPREEIYKKVKEFIKFWMKPVKMHNLNQLKKDLAEWPEISSFKKLKEEQRVKENCLSTDTSDGEDQFDEFGEYILYEEDNVNIFMNLLKSFEDSDSEFSD